jgi:phosphoribosyl 1,2-cyclic phosphodiesterase
VLSIASLNSGSNGNCYYVANANEAVLVDVGLSCRETEKRMGRLGLKMDKVKAIFVSHEHSDHIRGVEVTSRKHKIPVYINKKTLNNSGLRIDEELIRSFAPHEPVNIGGLVVKPFPKNHDAVDPYSFVVSGNEVNIGVFTDIGSSCEHLKNHFSSCHAAFLESNYDEDMLMNGHYPAYLKKRISGKDGHLSNAQALDLFLKHKPNYMSLVLLSHLSKENNTPAIAQALFSKHAGETEIVVASRYQESELYTIKCGEKVQTKPPVTKTQLSLF